MGVVFVSVTVGAGCVRVFSSVMVVALVIGAVSAGAGATAADSVTVTVDVLFLGTMLTLVLVPTADALPLPGAALLVYAFPELSTFAGPGSTPAFAGAEAVAV